jgi:thioredoxin 1
MPTLLLVAGLAACGPGNGAASVTSPSNSQGDAAVTSSDAGVTAAASVDIVLANRPGEMVVIEDLLVPGKVTVVDFWAEWCGACKEVDAKLLLAITGEPGIAVRKIDILDDDSPVAKHYDIGVLPHIRIYSRDGELLYALIGDNAHSIAERLTEVLGGASDG